MFEPANGCPVALFAAVVDSLFHTVLARNNSEQEIQLPQRLQVDTIMDLKVDGCYYLHDSEEAQELAIKLPKQAHQTAWTAKAFAMLASGSPQTDLRKPSVTTLETVLPSGITVYGAPDVIAKLEAVVVLVAECRPPPQ